MKTFKFLQLNNKAISEQNKVSEKFQQLLNELEVLCPPGREFSILRNKLQEACFYANKSISLLPSNWKVNEN